MTAPTRTAPVRRRPDARVAPLLALSVALLASCGDGSPLLFPPTTDVRPVVSAEFEGTVGRPLDQLPEIRAVDSRGNPAPGVEVRLTLKAGGGSVSPLVTLTDEQGIAKPNTWVLGETAGTNVLALTVEGVGETEFTARGLPGPAAQLDPVSGNRQEGVDGQPLPEPVVVRVMDEFGNPVSGETVTFEPVPGNGSAFPSEVVTDTEGLAATTWTLGPDEGTQRLRAVAGTGAQTTLTANGAFLIELVFVDEPNPVHRAAFESAAARWESVMAGGLAPIQMDLDPGRCGPDAPALRQVVDDVLIFVVLRSLQPHILGQAGPCWIRLDGALPIVGLVTLNTMHLASMAQQGILETVVLHEIGHVLGIGTMWAHSTHDFLRDPSLPDNVGADTHFDGPQAVSAFDAAGGVTYQGRKVPVENDFNRFETPAGSLDGHWRISAFGNELMVGAISPTASAYPLSAITIASLADLGYEVNLHRADPFSILAALRLPPAEAPIVLHDDIYRGPIGVVDRDGRQVGEFRLPPRP